MNWKKVILRKKRDSDPEDNKKEAEEPGASEAKKDADMDTKINQDCDEVITVYSTGRVGENYGLGYYTKGNPIRKNEKYMGVMNPPSGEGYKKFDAKFFVHYSKEEWSTAK